MLLHVHVARCVEPAQEIKKKPRKREGWSVGGAWRLGSKESQGYPVIVRYLSSEFRYTGYI